MDQVEVALAPFRHMMYGWMLMAFGFALLLMFAQLIFAVIERMVIEFFKDLAALFGRPRISESTIRRARGR